jgi:hypothetical protein
MNAPSTEWRETIAPDEPARFARQAERLRAAHAAKNARYGKGRFLHRREIIGAAGSFEVFADLPEHAAHGLFRVPASYRAVVRLSKGSMDIESNAKPDIRGFAIRVTGLSGPGALGGTTDHQDFLLINHDVFGARDSDEFVDIACHAAKGQLALLWHLLRAYGPAVAFRKLKALATTLGKPFAGYAAERFSTALPHRNGPYAVKLIVTPQNPSRSTTGADYAADIRDRIARGPLVYDVSLQFFTDAATTPIEDNLTVWPETHSPLLRVGRLSITEADVPVDELAFDPWGGLEDHRPLGEVMRARKSAYHLSASARRQG